MSLTPAQEALILATVPILREGGEALTRHFYSLMFRNHPEVRSYFNASHQKDGRQPRALANAVLAYAENIRNPSVLGPAIRMIVHKHASLDIRPEHYPIVGSSLLEAMAEVLGDAFTPELRAAWEAAYWQLANLLIGEEEKVYADHASRPGGWRGTRTFQVVARIRESSVITSFLLAPVDGRPVLDHVPGQFIGLTARVDGELVRRNYSLSNAPNGRTYRISVKREPEGVMSRHLHDHLTPGHEVELSCPTGAFTLDDAETPVNLITAGVGITPAMAMIEAYAGRRPIRFIHAAISRDHHAFRSRTDALAHAHEDIQTFYLYEDRIEGDEAHAEGRLQVHHLRQTLIADAPCYFLGPVPFMRSVRNQLEALGVPSEQQHFEFFGPADALD